MHSHASIQACLELKLDFTNINTNTNYSFMPNTEILSKLFALQLEVKLSLLF